MVGFLVPVSPKNIVTFVLVLYHFVADFFADSIRLECLEPAEEFSKRDAE
ncbi:hypothetical protein VCRA2114E365_100140 [Vibrio crassostreae]|nr:hypothetical protein VCRA2113O356_100034 [Vibrio crassostreae]CAK1716741.1 hypothetical protein VCRA2113O358_110033 [Vibrio crassostreae]CAK2270371.1 hypothetical protein VCRA2117O378_90034 [Vibrio crassostreae]CAK2389666.1 hypothetical protein VCRA2119O386_80141 [Vibrio crassostreae]CAK2497863.1 hypothetical protein VCRA2114E366_30034 [Vibrio crassostreae]